jgi:hypothetical protein
MSDVPTEREKQLLADKEAAEKAASGMSEELIALRKRAQDAEAKADAEEAARKAKEAELANLGGNKPVPELVEELLSKREKEALKRGFETAEEEFKSAFKEFLPENDAGGLKYAKFKKELEKFNFSNVASKEEYISRMKDAYKLMNPGVAISESPINHSSPSHFGVSPKVDEDGDLTSKESALIKMMGWTKERFMEVKKKRPHYVNSLLQL